MAGRVRTADKLEFDREVRQAGAHTAWMRQLQAAADLLQMNGGGERAEGGGRQKYCDGAARERGLGVRWNEIWAIARHGRAGRDVIWAAARS